MLYEVITEFITPAEYKKLDKIYQSKKYALKPFDQLGTLKPGDRNNFV